MELTKEDIKKYLEKQEAIIYNLQEFIKSITYRTPKTRNTDIEEPLLKIVNTILLKITKTSCIAGPEGEEYYGCDVKESDYVKLFRLLNTH